MSEERLKELMREGSRVCYLRREVSGVYRVVCKCVRSVIHKIIQGEEVLCAELDDVCGNAVVVVRAEDVVEF